MKNSEAAKAAQIKYRSSEKWKRTRDDYAKKYNASEVGREVNRRKSALWRRRHPEKCKEIQNIYRSSEKGIEKRTEWRTSESGRSSACKLSHKSRMENPERHKAYNILKRAVLSGAIERPTTCCDCGAFGPTDGHHENYAKPLDVIWVCRLCHKKIHMLKLEQASQAIA